MRRPLKVVAAVAGGLLVLAAAAVILLDPIATWRTRRALAGLDGMRGTFSDVDVRLRELSYEIRDLRIEKLAAGGAALPFFQVARASFGLYGRELLQGHLVARVELDQPKLSLVEAKQPAERQSAEETPAIGRRIERLAPFRLDRVEVKDGEIVWIEAREEERPVLWLHGMEATLENFASRAALAKHEPTVLAARAILERSGEVSAFATADPLAKELTFAGQGVLRGLALREVGELLAAKSDVVPKEGSLDLYVRFRAVDGRLSGGVRPVVRGADLEAGKPGIAPKVKAFVGDAALEIFEDEETGAVATTIPIVGTVGGVQAQAVPTILGVLRNAFVRGLEGGLEGLPPPRAKEKEGVLRQARRALSPGGEGPRAQPTREEGGR
jgi:hypothetical protein